MFTYFTGCLSILVLLLASPTILAADVDATQLRIDVPFLELHSGPGSGYPVIHVIEQNEQVTVLVKRTSWFKVKDKRGLEGWFNEDELFGLSHKGIAITQSEYNAQDYQQRNIEAGVMYGDMEGASFYHVSLGYALTDVFTTELSAGKALGAISDSDLYEFMLISHPLPELWVTPYIGIGGGLINTRPHSIIADAEDRQYTLMSAATGLKYHVARNFLIRAEYKFSLVLTDRDENEEIKTWKIGFSVFF